MKAKITKSNDQVWRELRARLKVHGRAQSHVQVGVLGDSGTHHSGFSMVELAAVHEFGSPAAGIPERSFIRSALRDRKDEMTKLLTGVAKRIIDNKMTIDQGLGQLGLWAATAIKKQIIGQDIPPPLKASTVAKKGSSKPLVDTGQLLGAISWKVVG